MPIELHTGLSTVRNLLGYDLRLLPRLETDVLVIGSGIAGASAALSASAAGAEVLLITKGSLKASSSHYAQGGVSAVLRLGQCDPEDSLEAHVNDTLIAGAGLCDEAVVRDVLQDAASAAERLVHYNCDFTKTISGSWELGREGGHSFRRILHAHGDRTGAEILRALHAAVRVDSKIRVLEDAYSIDLLDGAGISGALIWHKGTLQSITAPATIVATGGTGRLWRETTNPEIATGDGLAMAYRAGAQVIDTEFVQFHPTTLYVAGAARLLITEALRGEGAILKNRLGDAFMGRYHPQADLAPRDIVALAIVEEIRQTRFPHVWLDATHLGSNFLAQRFPGVTQECKRLGIDPGRDWIPVHPSAHYHCGGIQTDAHGLTNLPGLWAAGECGSTGLHGANRLASNSILECLVVGHRAGLQAASRRETLVKPLRSVPNPPPAPESLDISDLQASLRSLLWRQTGLERTGKDLETARRTIRFWLSHQAAGSFSSPQGWNLQDMLLCAGLITDAAHARKESRGTHRRLDDQNAAPEILRRAWKRPG